MSYKTVKSAADDTDERNERSPCWILCWIAFITRPISLVFLLPRTCRPQAPPQETRSTGRLWKMYRPGLYLIPCSHLEPFDFEEEVLARFRCPAPWGYNALVNASCAKRSSLTAPPPPPSGPDPRALALFSPRDMANSRGWGRKMRANSPSSINTAAFFIDRTFEWCLFKHLTSDFFVSINVCFSRRDYISSWFHSVIKLLTLKCLVFCKVICSE